MCLLNSGLVNNSLLFGGTPSGTQMRPNSLKNTNTINHNASISSALSNQGGVSLAQGQTPTTTNIRRNNSSQGPLKPSASKKKVTPAN
jgi:hypothetical protein